jgi:cyclophilin family peptidyl-prolyl cis-trans isomerase
MQRRRSLRQAPAEVQDEGRDNPDGRGFAAFGRVVRGMDVVRAIQSQPARGPGHFEQISASL